MIIPFRRPATAAAQPKPPPASRAEDIARAESAVEELMQMLRHAYADRANCIHAPTIIGGAAALTGEFALRATGLPLPKMGFVFGDPINAILFEGGDDQATMWEIIETTAFALGLSREDLPDARDVFGRIAAAAAAIMQHRGTGTMFPPLSISDPTEWSPNARPRLRGAVQAIAARYRLTPLQTALALAMATGNLIHQRKGLLPPKIAFQLAVEIMFATAKMAPLTKGIQ